MHKSGMNTQEAVTSEESPTVAGHLLRRFDCTAECPPEDYLEYQPMRVVKVPKELDRRLETEIYSPLTAGD